MTGRALAGRLALAAGAAALLATWVGAARSPADTAPTAPAGRIFFAANRLPLWYGEIYRVTAAGRRIDLSRSPAADVGPAVSPDGRWVAFLSARGGSWAVWVVGIDGRGLRRVSMPLAGLDPTLPRSTQIAWAPDSLTLAATVGGPTSTALYVGLRTGVLHRVARGVLQQYAFPFSWSPDGRFLAYATTLGEVDVVTPAGKRLWATSGTVAPSAWSAGDRLAVSSVQSTVSVFAAGGRLVTRFAGAGPVWSPGGRLLASATRYAVDVRRDGAGTPVARWPIQHVTQIQWVGSTRVRAFGQSGWAGYDVARHRAWRLSGVAVLWASAVSPDGTVVGAEYGSVSAGTPLVRSTVGSRTATTIAHAPFCGDDGSFTALAVVPRSADVVYEVACDAPSADIYSVAPDGTDLRQITHSPQDDLEPSLSPDGQAVVYTQQLFAARCSGCAETLWSVPAGGGSPRPLTHHQDSDAAPFDANASWSPDGSQLAFQNSGANVAPRLLTMPAAGGAARDLHVRGAAFAIWTRQGIVVANWAVPQLRIELVDPASGATRTLVQGGGADPDAVAESGQGRLAYLYHDKRGDALIGIVGSQAAPLDLSALLPQHARVGGLAWSPDGTRLAFAADDANGVGEVWTIGADGHGLRQVTRNLGVLDVVPSQSTLSWG